MVTVWKTHLVEVVRLVKAAANRPSRLATALRRNSPPYLRQARGLPSPSASSKPAFASPADGVGVGGEGVAVDGTSVAVGTAVGEGLATGEGVGDGDGLAVGDGVSVAGGEGLGVGLGAAEPLKLKSSR